MWRLREKVFVDFPVANVPLPPKRQPKTSGLQRKPKVKGMLLLQMNIHLPLLFQSPLRPPLFLSLPRLILSFHPMMVDRSSCFPSYQVPECSSLNPTNITCRPCPRVTSNRNAYFVDRENSGPRQSRSGHSQRSRRRRCPTRNSETRTTTLTCCR